jgi:tetratricopeptide (TPR) repeat protein
MGTLQMMKRDERGARQSFERAIKLDANTYEAIAGLVTLDVAAKKYRDAITLVESELAKRPTAGPLLVLAARTYAAAGDSARTEVYLKKAIESDPGNLQAYTLLGQLYLSQRRLDQALAEFDRLSKLQARPAGAHTMAGIILEAQGRVEEATKRYEAALAIDPAAAVAANNLAWLTAESGGNLDVALQLARTAKQGLPDQPQVDDTLGWIYYKKELPSLAIPPLQQAAQRTPQNPVYHFHLGLAYMKSGDTAKARASLAQALKLNPNFRGADEARRVMSETR